MLLNRQLLPKDDYNSIIFTISGVSYNHQARIGTLNMTLYNITRKTTLTTNLKEAKSTIDKLLGLHLKTNPHALLFKTRFGIHTFLLKSAIDVLILNDQNRVVIKKTLKPNRILIYNPNLQTVIELPKGTNRNSNTLVGDRLTFNQK